MPGCRHGYSGPVTRIIAGSARGTVLAVPGVGTRPTSDRVRESLFGMLAAAGDISGAAVLDLYAGSGALGLEALSRGAASADLVERGARAAQTARRNAARVARTCAGAPARVHHTTTQAFLRTTTGPFDLVFADPPYDAPDDDVTTVLALLAPVLTDDAVVVVERSSRSAAPAAPPRLGQARSRRYGDTTLWWWRAGSTDDPPTGATAAG